MRKFIIASHDEMALGMKKTLDFITNYSFQIEALCAYVDGCDPEIWMREKMQDMSAHDEAIILTDMLSGSVNQACAPYRSEHVFLIAGCNLPLALELLLIPHNIVLDQNLIKSKILNAKEQIVLLESIDEMDDE